jgi:glycosyltransferase involved in cell wall biosynthesis
MFLCEIAPFNYSNPWDLPINARLSDLSRKSRRVAYYYEAPNNSTFRYRAYNPTQVFESHPQSEFSASYFFSSDRSEFSLLAELADSLVICRSGYNDCLNNLIQHFRLRKKPIYFDIDDLVFDVSYAHQVINTLDLNKTSSATWDNWFGYIARAGHALSMCDAGITTNRFLGDQITKLTGLSAFIVPNFMNKEQIDISAKIFSKKVETNFLRNELVSIGYFSGSPSHQKDFELVKASLIKIMKERSDVELVVAGYIEAGDEFKQFNERFRYIAFTDYVNLQREMSKVELNVVPLQNTVFSNCKSELKYFEAAAAGTLTIASPTATYSAAITHGVNGFLSLSHDWYGRINEAIDAIPEYSDLAAKANQHALRNYSWEFQYETIVSAVTALG